jgi:phosphohistidine phosphatase
MIVLFVRHADAEDSSPTGDMGRRLTGKGRDKSAEVGTKLASLYGTAQRVYASPAIRAVETAEALAEALGTNVEVTDLLAPGSGPEQFSELVREAWGDDHCIVLVGHEPDFSSILSRVTAGGGLSVKVGKLCVVEVDVDKTARGRLKMVLPYGAA